MSKSIPAETVRGEGNSAIAPDTGRPLSRVSVMRFAIGFTFFSVLWAMSATMGSSMLLPQRFNGLGIGRPEAILGIMNSVGVLFALVANLVFGAFSDATYSRFGRRTPWILSGGFVAGLGFYLTSVSVTLTGIVGWSVVQQIGLNMMIAPCVAVFADRIPEMTRGTMSAFYGAGALIGQSLGNIIGAQFLGNVRTGFTFGGYLLDSQRCAYRVDLPARKSLFRNGIKTCQPEECATPVQTADQGFKRLLACASGSNAAYFRVHVD